MRRIVTNLNLEIVTKVLTWFFTHRNNEQSSNLWHNPPTRGLKAWYQTIDEETVHMESAPVPKHMRQKYRMSKCMCKRTPRDSFQEFCKRTPRGLPQRIEVISENGMSSWHSNIKHGGFTYHQQVLQAEWYPWKPFKWSPKFCEIGFKVQETRFQVPKILWLGAETIILIGGYPWGDLQTCLWTRTFSDCDDNDENVTRLEVCHSPMACDPMLGVMEPFLVTLQGPFSPYQSLLVPTLGLNSSLSSATLRYSLLLSPIDCY